ncbi:MAG: RNA polymerase factor sigma-54 [Chlamydiales bacterium]|nr:RNA polymerase factor sigma-54 [Chlamydiales bacterium]
MRPALQITVSRQMHFSLALQQSLEILQMPQQDLALWLETEVEKNPLLEISHPKPISELHDLPYLPSLFEHLQKEIQTTCHEPLDQKIAEALVGYLDEKGFLTSPLEEIAEIFDVSREKVESILYVIQSFDPPGIGARDLRESLLIQLLRKKKSSTYAYQIVDRHFDDLLHGRYTQIKKHLKIAPKELTLAIEELAKLQLRPAANFRFLPAPTRKADLRAFKGELSWNVDIVGEEFPSIHIKKDLFPSLQQLKGEDQKTVKTWLVSAKWLLRSLQRRKKLLIKLATHLLHKQSAYLEHKGPLAAITTQDLAQEFGVHESTIHRALAEKMLEGPWGLIPLKSLLSAAQTIKNHKLLLQKLIEGENKESPLTDEELSSLLSKQGISLARRTVSKYRKELKFGSALRRKLYPKNT